ncbi:uncharacterized protein BXZ73DRAFT_37628 [Epithele typhae]|uniref:uncharacterized protein n=1 Tax=Epithele typhae TaxID=378194 RepID=UPI002008136B|nr:uncharacterized protein BXZ73DRAFT_37628 [Epithele typhae]KAH9946211.1 hypothetical protein BXZ73DRAFT_37628 [Epithele typhae]
MSSDHPALLLDLPPQHPYFRRALPPQPQPGPMYHRPIHYAYDWRSHPQPALFAGALAPSSWTNVGPSYPPQSLWHPAGPPDFLLPFHHYSARGCDAPGYSFSRSDTSSAVSRDSDLSPSPEVAEVVCNAPLVAPIPLPYHSPTFLLYDLPDDDEDLSHPPYTHRPHKRKRSREDDEDGSLSPLAHPVPAKRRHTTHPEGGPPIWDGAWASTAHSAAALPALRHPAAGFSRRNRAR